MVNGYFVNNSIPNDYEEIIKVIEPNWKNFAEFKTNDNNVIFIWHITKSDYVLFDKINQRFKPFKEAKLDSILSFIHNISSITFSMLKLCKSDKLSNYRGKKNKNVK